MIEQPTRQNNVQRPDWVGRAVVAGFFATAIVTGTLLVAFAFALLLGSPSPEAPTITHWLFALTHNVVTTDVETAFPLALLVHFAAGIAWAIVYAGLFEPRVTGPGWWRGLLFAPIPAILSLVVFLPAVGAGFLGLALGAGPLPIIGNLILHLVYGAVLGFSYAPTPESATIIRGPEGTVSAGDVWILRQEDRALAIGLVGGFIIGAILGVVIQFAITGASPNLMGALVGAIVGSAVGSLFGSFAGLSTPPSTPSN